MPNQKNLKYFTKESHDLKNHLYELMLWRPREKLNSNKGFRIVTYSQCLESK